MKNWRDILEKVLINEVEEKDTLRSSEGDNSESTDSLLDDSGASDILQSPLKRFYFCEENPALYFTRREVQCMYYLLHGFTIVKTAKKLALSHRTVEFYVKNMKMKLNLNTKSDLIECMMQLGFLDKIDFKP